MDAHAAVREGLHDIVGERRADVRSEARCTTKLELWTDADRSYCELRPSLSPKDPDVIPSEKLCAAAKGETDMKRAMAKCDQALAVKPPFTCGKESGDKQDQEFCKVRAAQGKVAEAVGFEPESLCKLGRETYDAKPPSQAYDRRYPLAQFYLGGLGGSKKYEFITLRGDTPSNEGLPKRVLNAAVGATFIPGLGRFPPHHRTGVKASGEVPRRGYGPTTHPIVAS